MRARGWLGKTERLTSAKVSSLLSRSHAEMTHAAPAGMLRCSNVRDVLEQRRDDGELALKLAPYASVAEWPVELRRELLEAEDSHAIVEWLNSSEKPRQGLPPRLLRAGVAVGLRSVDNLIADYERGRCSRFTRDSSGRLIPVSEVDALVAFANVK